MRIEIITMWYNEAFLAPFFLAHYAWADKITLLYDRDTTDNTPEIVKTAPNVTIIPFRFPDMLDDGLKQMKINERYTESDCDWVALVDADEFLFYQDGGVLRYDLRSFLAASSADVYHVPFFHVHRHKDDADLDTSLPAVPQRRHGVADAGKPCVARGGQGIRWKAGCHWLIPDERSRTVLHDGIYCAHWAMADPCFAFERRLKNRRQRQSRENMARSMGFHNQNITPKDLQREFEAHAEDGQLF